MKQDGSVALFQYWNRLRGNRPAPKRTEVEPADIKTLLADTFILEKDARGEAVFRLAGTRLCAIFGKELKGLSFASLWAGRDQTVAGKLARSAFDAKSVVTFCFEGHTAKDDAVSFELLLLPLDGGIESPRALGSLIPCERPFWLGAEAVVECRMTSLRIIDPDRDPVFVADRPSVTVPPLAPNGRSITDSLIEPGQGRRFRHLVVFEGGRSD
ncbi:PAS domain-containing protein [Nitratireductor sp. ZSWI3]|uniref:PAS domain-containing protein n=1 Tax=Nitratireductor sp. ZSWI3 TaxID=2966359 RepID=UPI00214FE237|nr:PAS domain-containing protein [Nitratireductor sp. ZSWI3]MCR4266470.1 PAS domain-containing protein [Nitratireductor sp. ZSWI3]